MQPEAARLRRLQRLERVRAIARHDALRAAALAETSLSQLRGLAGRTAAMVLDYHARAGIGDGAALARHHAFLTGLAGVHAATSGDAARAQALADRMQEELAQAERSRAAVDDRARAEARRLELRRLAQGLSSQSQTRRKDPAR